MSDSIHHKLYIVAESEYGTTPSGPTFGTLRHTSCSLALSKQGFRSAELNAHRNLQDFRHGNKQIGGDIGFELSYGTYDVLLEALLMGTWDTNVLKVGTTRRSFSFLRHFNNQEEVEFPFHLFKGVEINMLSLNVVAGKIVSGTFGTIGREVEYLGEAPASSAFQLPTTSKALDGFSGSVAIGGQNYPVTEISLKIENGLTPNFVLFDDRTSLPSSQMCSVTGEVGVRFEDAALLQAFADADESNLIFNLQLNGDSVAFNLPRVMLNGGQPDVGGEGPINLKIPFQAIYDAGNASSLVITRQPD
jgi:hypothetical protein